MFNLCWCDSLKFQTYLTTRDGKGDPEGNLKFEGDGNLLSILRVKKDEGLV